MENSKITTPGITPQLAKAILNFQKNAPEITLDKEVKAGNFSYKYASLKHILDKCREPLESAGLTFTQVLENTKVTTQLIEVETGSFIESVLEIKAKDDPKSQGAAITYARRYAIGALLGIVPDDDEDAPEAKQETRPPLNEKMMLQVIERVSKGEKVLEKVLQSFSLTADQVYMIVDHERAASEEVTDQKEG